MKHVHAHQKPILMALSIAALLSFGAAASAQVVNIDLRNARILNNVANNLSVEVRNVPITVQAPINVAAQVCNVSAAILGTAYNRGGATCTAQQTSLAFLNIVQEVIDLQQSQSAKK
jgi:hypothetical protein